MKIDKNVILCILDGWGNAQHSKYNAISSTDTPCWNNMIKQYPYSQLVTSGVDVGLPQGQIGNSEVGHINIGSGRIILQDLPRINNEINNIENNVNFINFIQKIKSNNGFCHIAGLLSDGGIHSHQEHIYSLISTLSKLGIKVLIHAFLDGRDTAPQSAIKYIQPLNQIMKLHKNVHLSTISGRFYSMDRDNNLDRIEKAYKTIALAQGYHHSDAISAIKSYYKQNITDEFIEPTVIGNYQGFNQNDGLITANFRSDRMIQLVKMILNKIQEKAINLSAIITMTEYSKDISVPALFPTHNLKNTLGEVLANHNLKQLRIAETEKYAHVTFFFNGGREEPFVGEDRSFIPSPTVRTYDLKPEMSAFEVTGNLIESINSQKYSLIVVNYANADMVGHTGNMQATQKAISTLDQCLSKVLNSAINSNSILVVTADHGNAEEMFDIENSVPYTAHTLNNVPFLLCNYQKNITLKNGRLCDIAPTILELLNIEKPEEMTGNSLICNLY